MSFPARVVMVLLAAYTLAGCASSSTDEGATGLQASEHASTTVEEAQRILASATQAPRSSNIEEARQAVAAGSQFSRELYHGYLDLAEQEFREGNGGESDQYTQKAMLAASGTSPDPAKALERELPRENRGESISARARLMYSLNNGGRERWPQESARAQVMYDCWVQEQSENEEPEHIRECRNSFIIAMARLEGALWPRPRNVAQAGNPADPDQSAPIEQGQVAALPPDSAESSTSTAAFIIYFPFDKYFLTPSAKQVLKEVVDHLKSGEISRIDLVGHADRSGGEAYNQNLSMERAQAVAAALRKVGIDKSLMSIAAMGESMPAVPTPDGVRNPQNRRVEIHFSEKPAFSEESGESKEPTGSENPAEAAPPQSPSQ